MKNKAVYIVVYDSDVGKKVWSRIGTTYESFDGSLIVDLWEDVMLGAGVIHIRDNIDMTPEEFSNKDEEIGAAEIRKRSKEKLEPLQNQLNDAVKNAKKLLGED